MKKYIVFLRGINVGGKNKVTMPRLKAAFEENGFKDVTTYINSGNLLFSSDNQDTTSLKLQSEAIIQETFDLDIPVSIISAKELAASLESVPKWWGDGDKDMIHYAIFLIPPTTASQIIEVLGEVNPEFEKLASIGNTLYWSIPRTHSNQSKWSKISSSKVNRQVTIRNANTVKKMISLAQK